MKIMKSKKEIEGDEAAGSRYSFSQKIKFELCASRAADLSAPRVASDEAFPLMVVGLLDVIYVLGIRKQTGIWPGVPYGCNNRLLF